MQTNMKKPKSRRNKMLVIAFSASLAVLALVSRSTAQPAANAPAAANAARNNTNDLITDGLTDGKLNLAVNKTGVITTKSPIKRIVIGQPDVIKDNMIGPNTILLTAL